MENSNHNYQELVGQPFQSIEPEVSQPYQTIEPINYIDSQIEAEIKWQKFQQQEEMRKAMLPRYYTEGKVESKPIVQLDDSPSLTNCVGQTFVNFVKMLLLLIILAVLMYSYIFFWN